MAIVPKQIVKRIAFYATRVNRIASNAQALEIPADVVQTFEQHVEPARAAFRRQQAA